MSKLAYVLFFILSITACGGQKKTEKTNTPIAVTPKATQGFNADSAFTFVKDQVDFGSRVPGTEAHQKCADYYVNKFNNYGAQVSVQEFTAKGYEGTMWKGKNIIASYLPQEKERILLCAHWDSRFIAEQDENKDRQKDAIDGANDGASGVGVLIEFARQFQLRTPNVGIDIVLFDVEDQGAPYYAATTDTEDSWCLGSQYWSKEAVNNNYQAKFGILLDMVGASDAVFMKEQISMYYAKEVVEYIWNKAYEMNYSNYFINKRGGILTDDHVYVNRIAKIPCIDIIDYDDTRGGFNHTWHTHNDVIDNIDKNTLKAVGTVVLSTIYDL